MEGDRLDDIYWALRVGLGGTAFVAGADKFTNLLTDWEKYVAPQIERRLPVSARNWMRIVGVIEMAVGAGILTRQTRWASLVASGWLLCIAADLIMNGDYDIATRDVNMAIGAFALSRMDQARQRRREISSDWTAEQELRRAA